MTMESDLTARLKTVSANVFPDFVPAGTAAPWITYQHIGGQPMQYVDGTAADKRHTLLQINVWAGSRLQALSLARQVETAVCNLSLTPFVAQPASEPITAFEPDVKPTLYGCMQDFDIWSSR